MRTKNKRNQWQAREEFFLARKRSGLSQSKAAEVLGVTLRTIRNWENGKSRVPYSAFRLMRMQGGHCLMAKGWEDWSVWNGQLWTPEGRGFAAHELRYIAHYLWMARRWLAEQQAAASGSKPPSLDTLASDQASSVSPAPRVPLTLSGAGLGHDSFVVDCEIAGLQEKTRSEDTAQIARNLAVLSHRKNGSSLKKGQEVKIGVF